MKKSLPQLIKQSATYSLFVPAKVEEKIRYLIRKFPHTEWSGILFYTYAGGFETNDLEIYCEDIFPMDLGTAGWTEFRMTPDITAYIADNIDLFGCEIGILHSHHTMGAFFSGQDISTLHSEGNDTNCFVSLIVDTRGTYQAAITRKVQSKNRITTKHLGSSYEFFGEGGVQLEGGGEETKEEVENTVIEYFMLNVQREVVDNPLEMLDKRFEEIERQKETQQEKTRREVIQSNTLAAPYKGLATATASAFNAVDDVPSLFSEEEMNDMVDPTYDWEPDEATIHYMVCQMLTCSLIVDKGVDLKQWVTRHMVRKYKEIFHDQTLFENWVEFIIEFQMGNYDLDVPPFIDNDIDIFQNILANAMYREISKYPSNQYLEMYKKVLLRYE